MNHLSEGVLDHGFVALIDVMGDEAEPARAARISYGPTEERAWELDAKLIRYLHEHRHTSPFEMVETKWRVRLPIFVAREWVRHRTASLNEFSQRYADVRTLGDGEVLFHAPETWRAQDAKNKQGSAGELDEATQRAVSYRYDRAVREAVEAYEFFLEKGVAREQARIVLPVSTYTEMVWKIDLHNLLHFLALRTDATAQAEFRGYALAMERILRNRWPRLLDIVRPEAS